MSIGDVIRRFVAENSRYRLYENYSGKGLQGTSCLGVIVHNGDSFMEFLMNLTQFMDEQGVEDADLELEGVSYDSLGPDTIVYFPRIED